MSAILFFDPASGGHHGEFLENLIYGLPLVSAVRSIILTHPDLEARLEAAKADCGSRIKLIYLSREQLDLLDASQSLRERGRLELKQVEQSCEELSVSRVFLLHMNIHQLALSYCLKQKGLSVRGLLLSPYTPLRRAVTFKQKLFAFFTGVRNQIQLHVMLSNQRIDKVFILNDSKLALELNRFYPKRRPFTSVVDPIPAAAGSLKHEAGEAVGESDRFTFLLFGSMDPRKGALETLRSMARLSQDELAKIRLRIVGRSREGDKYRSALLDAIEDVRQKSNEACIELEDRYIDFDEMGDEFRSADCILIPYIHFYGSSGVLGHACRHGKAVIACEEGLIGELVRELRIGETINPSDAIAFASCMRRAKEGDFAMDLSRGERYVELACYRRFSENLVADWCSA